MEELCQEGELTGCGCYTILSPLTVKRKCHHEGNGGIEQEGAKEINGVK